MAPPSLRLLLTTVVVFIPLAFIQGLVGEFFTPLRSFRKLCPGGVNIRGADGGTGSWERPCCSRGIFPRQRKTTSRLGRETWLQRLYSPILIWTLRHKFISLLAAIIITGSSISLITIIPVTFFPAGTPDYLIMNIELKEGTAVSRTYEQVAMVEEVLDQFVEEGHLSLYQVTIGQAADDFEVGVGTGSLHLAGFTMRGCGRRSPGKLPKWCGGDCPNPAKESGTSWMK